MITPKWLPTWLKRWLGANLAPPPYSPPTWADQNFPDFPQAHFDNVRQGVSYGLILPGTMVEIDERTGVVRKRRL